MKPIRMPCRLILPAVYDDSLSYYEQVTKLVDKINEVISDLNVMHTDYEKMLNYYEEFRAEVNRVILPKLSELDTKMERVLDEVRELNTLVTSLYNYSKAYTDAEVRKTRADLEWKLATQINLMEQQILKLEKEIKSLNNNIKVFNPASGFNDTLNAVISDVYESARVNEGLTVGEYYASGITVGEYDAHKMSVRQYAMIGKKVINRFYKWFYNPYTGIKNTVANIASWNATEALSTMSVSQYAGLNLTVADYDALNLTVGDYLRRTV